MTLSRVFHLIHMTGDLPALEAWYDDVFAVKRGWMDNHYLHSERRDASLVTFADTVIEPLAPSFSQSDWEAFPLGRFYKRFGNHWHSIAWFCDDNLPYWQKLRENNIRILGTAGAATDQPPPSDQSLFTHPKDTMAQLEIEPPREFRNLDPRVSPDYDPLWWVDNHPLGLYGMSYTTILTKDLSRGEHVYADVLGGTVIERSSSELTGTDDVYVKVGEAVVQLSKPNRDGTIAADEMNANGEIHHAAAFRVADLDKAEEYLASKGIKTVQRDAQTILSDPATTHGVPFRWTTRVIPGGTFAE